MVNVNFPEEDVQALKFKNKTFDRFLNCSGETENQIYVLKKLN